jgi:hypothetical protein
MNIFKSFTLTWWQLGLLKLSLVCVGIIFGVYFQAFFLKWIVLVTIAFVVPAIYVGSVWIEQRSQPSGDLQNTKKFID